MSEQTAQLDQLFDEQRRISQSMTRLKNVLGVDAMDHDELIEQLVHKMEQSQLIKTESERLNYDLSRQKSEQSNLRQELQQLEHQYDDVKEQLIKAQKELTNNKVKYESQSNQSKQSFEQIGEEKHQLEVQLEQVQSELIHHTRQYDEFQRKFKEFSQEKDEQLAKSQDESNQQQILIENLRRESNDTHDELKSKSNEMLTLQNNFDKLHQTLQSKLDEIERLNEQILAFTDDQQQQEQLLAEQKQLKDVHSALESKFNLVLTEKAGLENQLDSIRIQMQTTESTMTKKRQDTVVQLEQAEIQVKELQVSRAREAKSFSTKNDLDVHLDGTRVDAYGYRTFA